MGVLLLQILAPRRWVVPQWELRPVVLRWVVPRWELHLVVLRWAVPQWAALRWVLRPVPLPWVPRLVRLRWVLRPVRDPACLAKEAKWCTPVVQPP